MGIFTQGIQSESGRGILADIRGEIGFSNGVFKSPFQIEVSNGWCKMQQASIVGKFFLPPRVSNRGFKWVFLMGVMGIGSVMIFSLTNPIYVAIFISTTRTEATKSNYLHQLIIRHKGKS